MFRYIVKTMFLQKLKPLIIQKRGIVKQYKILIGVRVRIDKLVYYYNGEEYLVTHL